MSQLQTPSQHHSQYPFENIEGNLFPPVCLKSHWDPTKMLRHILPQEKVTLVQDFRPYVKVCKKYVTSGPAMEAPLPPDHMVFPMGGEFYPPGRYSQAIDEESALRTLDKPLDKWCPSTRYIPAINSNMYVANTTLPDRKPIHNAFVAELSMPQAILRSDVYTCRSANDTAYFQRSGRLFNNPTKQDRYGADKFYALNNATVSMDTGMPFGRGDPMPHGAVNKIHPTASAVRSQGGPPQPGGAMPLDKLNDFRRLTAYQNQKGVTMNTDCTSVVGVATCGSAAPVW